MNWYDKAYSSFTRNILFRLHEGAKGHCTFRMIGEMEQAQWIAPEELRQLQQQRLQALLGHAFRSVKYYADVSQRFGFRARDFQTTSDLDQFPFLSKDVIRGRLDDLKSCEARGILPFTTGGSTGSPVTFYLGPTRVSSDVAARWRAEKWWGIGIGDREFVFWGSPLELTKQDRMRDMRDKIFRTRLMSAFEMSLETMDAYLDELQRRGCVRVFGYPSSIFLLCEHARRRGRDLSKLGVHAVFVTAEYLWDHWRQTISEAFHCPVANGYGGRDSGFIAHECPAGGMHITADRLIVEIVDDDGRQLDPGELGEIVVTHLDTPEMPFIRYRTGDMGVLNPTLCSCGRSLPLLEKIDGRKSDFIVTPDGRRMHGLSLIYVLRKIPGIEQFRITQKTVNDFELELVTTTAYKAESEREIAAEFKQRLRAPLNISMHYCAAISPSNSGKYRYVISEVDQCRSGPAAKNGSQLTSVTLNC